MPRGDGSGPQGLGPLTGRGGWMCAADPTTTDTTQNQFAGRGMGRGMGMGRGRCRFLGQTNPTRAGQPAVQTQETDALRSEVQALRTAVSELTQRLDNA